MIEFKPIGIIRSPFKVPAGMPIQPAAAKGIRGKVELDEKYEAGLSGLEGFSHIFLIYNFHLSTNYELKVIPYLDKELKGVFATRAPRRPNQIGISIVNLEKIEKNILYIRNVDIVDGTPLLDLKPFVPSFDCFDIDIYNKTGWLQDKKDQIDRKKSDNRFNLDN